MGISWFQQRLVSSQKIIDLLFLEITDKDQHQFKSLRSLHQQDTEPQTLASLLPTLFLISGACVPSICLIVVAHFYNL